MELVVADDGVRATLLLRSNDGLWSAATHRGGHSAALPLSERSEEIDSLCELRSQALTRLMHSIVTAD
ncbi:MAG: hypothetical protein WC703_07795 [Candidatus Neomarinimicrobiota bacterium]